MSDSQKYPKTFHFSFSENLQNDDRMLSSDDIFIDKLVVCSEKLDGECSGLSSTSCHARSLDSRDHISRHWLKSLWGRIKYDIPPELEIFGENVYASHSIFYDKLTTYFYVFAIFENGEKCLSWKETKEWCKLLELETVPELYTGIWDEYKIKSCWTGASKFGPQQEGYVVRNIEQFPLQHFSSNCAKWVRKGHVQTSEFWMNQPVIVNCINQK